LRRWLASSSARGASRTTRTSGGIRLHPRLGTVEIRICDAVTEDAVALAAFCQRSSLYWNASTPARESVPPILTTENSGSPPATGSALGHLATGRNRDGRPALRRTLRLEPHARELGCERSSGDPRDRRGSGPTASYASTTRTTTSSRSSASSRTRPRRSYAFGVICRLRRPRVRPASGRTCPRSCGSSCSALTASWSPAVVPVQLAVVVPVGLELGQSSMICLPCP
jgi:hypothetical protein